MDEGQHVIDTRHNLPLSPTGFVGREADLAEASAAFGAARLVTVTGPPGIGKTRFALELARRLLDGHRSEACWVELGQLREPGQVAQAVGSALGLDPEPGRDPVDALIAHLANRRLLFVIDNCEHLLAAAAVVVERLVAASRHITVVATSQRELGVTGEVVLRLPPLSLPQADDDLTDERALEFGAVSLFCTRAAAGHSGFRLTDELVGDVVRVCRRLDGIPLAIELAAARASVLSPAEIAERLDQRFLLLTSGAGAPETNRTLEAALDWSYNLLAAKEATLLRRLSIFAGGATLPAVEHVCTGGDIGEGDLIDLLSSLVAKSLLTADTSRRRARYRMLESVRAYAKDRLVEQGEDEAVASRLSSWSVRSIDRAWHDMTMGDPGPAIEALEADYDNIRSALERAVESEPAVALRMAAGLTPFWKTRGYFREGREWLDGALAAATDAPAGLRARALWSLGLLAILGGDVRAARAAVGESLALSRGLPNARATIAALNLLGFISVFAQDPASAMPLLEESVERARTAGDISSLTSALALHGRAHLFLGDTSTAQRVFEECLALSEDHGTPDAALIGVGWVALAQGRVREAESAFQRALPLVRQAAERFETALVLSFLGEAAWLRHELRESRAHFDEGLDLAEAMGAPFPLARCLSGLARVAQVQGVLKEAERLADESVKVARRAQLPHAWVRCLQVQGDVRQASGDAAGARKSFEEAVSLAGQNQDAAGAASSRARLGELDRLAGDHDNALALQHEALGLHGETGDLAGTARSLEALAGLALDRGRPAHGARLFGAAAALRESVGAVRPPTECATYELDVRRLGEEMPVDELEEAWTQGGRIGLDGALALAAKGRGARNRPPDGWASLTPAERQVVELATEGLTNPEIGEKLFISARTVQGHLARTYRKLGISSRRQLRELRGR